MSLNLKKSKIKLAGAFYFFALSQLHLCSDIKKLHTYFFK